MTATNRRPIDPAVVRWILGLYRQGGAPLAALASGRSRASVTRLAARHNVRAREWAIHDRAAKAETAAELYRDGWSTTRLATHFEVSRTTIGEWLRSAGCPLRSRGGAPVDPSGQTARRRRELTAQARRAEKADRNAAVAERYRAGETCAEIAADHGVCASTVRGWLRTAGVELRSRGSRPADEVDHQTAARMYAAGWSLAEVADHFGVGERTVRPWIAGQGVQIRRPGRHKPPGVSPVPVPAPPARGGASAAVEPAVGWEPPTAAQIGAHAFRDGWEDDAACRGMNPALFFPERGESTEEIKAVCSWCPVALDCAAYAITRFEKHGVWGGLSERQRRRIRRQLALEEAAA